MENAENPLSHKTPAQKFSQGGRDVYAFPLNLATLDRLLPDRVHENVAHEANRRLTPTHARKIQGYLESEQKWVLGAVLLGIDPQLIEFTPYPGQSSDAPVIAGELHLDKVPKDSMKLFDGQHRRRAVRDALNGLRANSRRGERLAILEDESIPIMLYGENDIEQLRQMFSDAARSKPIERNTLAQFDQRDAFNLAAESLLAFSEFLSGRIEMERPTVPHNNPNIMSINQLSQTLKTIEVGRRGRVSKELNDHHMLDIDALADKGWFWSDEFLPAAREEYDGLLSGNIDNSEIPEWRVKSMAFNATFFRILAGCYHEWLKHDEDWGPLASFVRGSNIEPGHTSGTLLVEAGAVLPGGSSPIARSRETEAAIDYIVAMARNSADS